jgi:hypothetical protein
VITENLRAEGVRGLGMVQEGLGRLEREFGCLREEVIVGREGLGLGLGKVVGEKCEVWRGEVEREFGEKYERDFKRFAEEFGGKLELKVGVGEVQSALTKMQKKLNDFVLKIKNNLSDQISAQNTDTIRGSPLRKFIAKIEFTPDPEIRVRNIFNDPKTQETDPKPPINPPLPTQ